MGASDDSEFDHPILQALYTESEEESLRLLRVAIEDGIPATDAEDQWLVAAAMHGRCSFVEELLRAGATMATEWVGQSTNPDGGKSPDPADLHGETALHVAAEMGRVDLVKVLVAADGKGFLDKFNISLAWTPLIIVALNGNIELAKVLLQAGADVNACDEAQIGDTAPAEAIYEGDVEMVKLLLARGADPLIPGWMQMTPLDLARDENNSEILKLVEARLQ